MTDYLLNLSLIPRGDALAEASREELRVLLALIARDGRVSDMDELAAEAMTSKARCSSSLVFWQEAGIISKKTTKKDDTPPTVTEEFEERIRVGAISDAGAEHTAKDIRDNDLAALISECAELMQRAALSTEEIKIISAIYTQYALDEDYIINLAAYIADKGKLTAARLGIEAEKLVRRGVTTSDELDKYIAERENETGAEWEFKHLAGIHNRNLSKHEREYVKRWYYGFAFGEDIVGEAYDISVLNTSKLSLPYMDKLLTHWHEAGCKTLEDCRRLTENEKAAKALTESKRDNAPPRLPRNQKSATRYGDFDINDAFAKALERSYGQDSETKG